MITFTVPGKPIAEGSLTAIAYQKRHPFGEPTLHAAVVHRSKAPLMQYRADIQYGWDTIVPRPPEPLEGPVSMRVRFSFARPKHHLEHGPTKTMPDRPYRVRETAPTWVEVHPDLDKLTRAVLDALSGRAYVDDRQVAHLEVQKAYGPRCMTTIDIRPAADRP